MKSDLSPSFEPGQIVEVVHLQGVEVGTIESINLRTGKVLIDFAYEDCPHFDSFNISQIRKIKLKSVGS